MTLHAIDHSRMAADASNLFSFPDGHGLNLQRWGGGLLLLVGLVLLATAYWAGQGEPQASLLLLGLGVALGGALTLGYVSEIQILVRERRILHRQGFFFITVTESVTFSDIKQVVLRLSAQHPDRMTRLRQRLQWRASSQWYELVLKGTREMLVDRTHDPLLAREWLRQLAAVVGVPARDTTATTTETPRQAA